MSSVHETTTVSTPAGRPRLSADAARLLSARHAWSAVVPGGHRLAYLVPAVTGGPGCYWHIAVLDPVNDLLDGTRRPVVGWAVDRSLQAWEVSFGDCDWRRCDEYGPSRANPFAETAGPDSSEVPS